MRSKNIKRIFGVLVIFAVALVTGVAVGKIYVDSIPANIVMGMTEAELRDSDADLKKLVDKSLRSRPDAFSAVELYQIAEYNLDHSDAFYKQTDGFAKNMVGAQTLHSYKLLRDGEFVFDNVSPGQMDVVTRVRHKVGTDVVTRNTNGKFANSAKNTGVWDDKDNETYNIESYKEKFNQPPLCAASYVISSKTCPDGSSSKVTKTKDGNYTFTIKLSGTYLTAATVHYSYEIFYTSYGILTSEAKEKKILPAWENSELTVVVDEDFNFVSCHYDEVYYVYTKFGYQRVNDVFTEKFTFDTAQMPTIEEVL